MRYGETEVMEIKNLLSKFHKNMKICEKKLKVIFFGSGEGRKFHGKNDLGKSN